MKPIVARPAATPTMFCSAMPIWRKRSGWAAANISAWLELALSPSSSAMSDRSSASFVIVTANASRSEPRPSVASPLNCFIELPDGVRQFVLGGDPGVPQRVGLHEGDALALGRPGDDHDGSAGDAPCPLEGAEDRREIMAVGLVDGPAGRSPMAGKRLELPWRLPAGRIGSGPAGLLELVEIDDRDEVVEAIAAGNECRFPDDPLLALAVAEHHPRPFIRAAQAAPHGDADRAGEADAEGTARHVESGQAGHVGMALESGVQPPERLQLLEREVAAEGHRRVQGLAGVALRMDVAIAPVPAWLVGSDVQLREVQGDQQVGRGERPAGMTSLRPRHRPDGLDADASGERAEALKVGLAILDRLVGPEHRSVPDVSRHRSAARSREERPSSGR